MSENRPEPPVDLGIYSRMSINNGLDAAEKVAVAITVIWIMLCLMFLGVVGLGDGASLGPLRFLVVMLALFLPVALIWIAAIALKSSRIIREESERLQTSMDAMRQIYVSQAQMAATTMGPNVERKIDEIVKGQQRTESAMANFATVRTSVEQSHTRPMIQTGSGNLVTPTDEQPALALAAPPGSISEAVSTDDFISALNFPETADDREGFAALRRALADRRAAQLIRSSQDILTLLSQDGIYMDDLSPDRARPEIWRRFAEGERGRAIAGLGGIRDRSSLALSSARMRQDTVFRDAAHHFLRAFDKSISEWSENLSDQDIAALAETRTARAFMLLGRVSGIFD